MQGSCRIAYPAGIETHVDDRLLDFRQAPPIAVVEQETALNTEGVLTEVTLGTPSCFAAFNDLITLTVRAADRDECHGPFLPKRGYENEAQCDSNLSPSPLLKHYRIGEHHIPTHPQPRRHGGGHRARWGSGGG